VSDKTWKAAERKVARDFGCERNPLSGGNSKVTRSDSRHKKLFIETKYRKNGHTAVTLYDSEKPKAKKEDKTLVIALVNGNRHGYWILIRPEDLPVVAEEYRKAKRPKLRMGKRSEQ